MPARWTRTSASPSAGTGSGRSRASASRMPSQRSARTRDTSLPAGGLDGPAGGLDGGLDAVGRSLGAVGRMLGLGRGGLQAARRRLRPLRGVFSALRGAEGWGWTARGRAGGRRRTARGRIDTRGPALVRRPLAGSLRQRRDVGIAERPLVALQVNRRLPEDPRAREPDLLAYAEIVERHLVIVPRRPVGQLAALGEVRLAVARPVRR